jgi:hypothetical protein
MATIPSVGFHTLVQTFGLQALMFCGRIPNPMTGKAERDLDMAQVQISFLEVLEEKTKGNLSEDEEKTLGSYLHEVRMAYIEAARAAKEEAAAKDEAGDKADPPTDPPADPSV